MTKNKQQIYDEQHARKVNEYAGQIVFVKGLYRYESGRDAITWGLGILRRILLPSDESYQMYHGGYWDNTDQVILDKSIGPQKKNKFLLCGRKEYQNYVAQIIDSQKTIVYEDKKSVDLWNNFFTEEFNKYPFNCDYLSQQGLEKILYMYGIKKNGRNLPKN